jgi:hypothetical protein
MFYDRNHSEIAAALRNLCEAEAHDTNESLRATSVHAFVLAHYGNRGEITRQCSRCLCRQVEEPGGLVHYVTLTGIRLGVEPGCVSTLSEVVS